MPLLPGKQNIGHNIETEMKAGKPHQQAIAIALETARRSARASGGGFNPTQMPWYARQESRNIMHSGPLMGSTPGRADKISTNVPNGSHVIPADIVSGLGQGNSNHGHAVLGKMFPMSTGPLGAPMTIHTPKPNFPKLPKFPGHAAGGAHHGDDVPVKLSDGEFLVSPEHVKRVGGGDIEKGHKILDAFILACRKKNIQTQKKLPGPAKD